MLNDLKHFIKKFWLVLLIFSAYITITYIFHIPNCFIKMIIGFPCPSCGLTRAGFAVLRLDFKEAFYYNPLIYLLPLILCVLIFKTSIFKKLYHSKLFWLIIISITIINYIIRLIYIYPNPPMDYDSNNVIAIIINYIINLFI